MTASIARKSVTVAEYSLPSGEGGTQSREKSNKEEKWRRRGEKKKKVRKVKLSQKDKKKTHRADQRFLLLCCWIHKHVSDGKRMNHTNRRDSLMDNTQAVHTLKHVAHL